MDVAECYSLSLTHPLGPMDRSRQGVPLEQEGLFVRHVQAHKSTSILLGQSPFFLVFLELGSIIPTLRMARPVLSQERGDG